MNLKSAIHKTSGPSTDDLIAIRLEVKNLSAAKKAEYKTWAGADFSIDRDYATLGDDVGNRYKRITFGLGTTPEERTERASLYPGEQVQDVLVFEKPVTAAKHLDLEMPGDNIGGTGMVRVRIPMTAVRHTP